MKSFFKVSLIATVIAILSACGGGGGSSSSPLGDTSSVSIGGVAAKGLIKNAKVQVYSTDASGKQSTSPIGETTTGSDGSYTLSISPQSNPVVVVVVPAAGSKVVDELTGSEEPLPTGFTLKAIVESVTQNATVGVNPFTDTAAAAIPTGGIKRDMVLAANYWVKTNLLNGIDPVTVQPALTPTAAQAADVNQKSITAALALIAAASKQNARCSGGATTADKFKCQVEDMRDTFQLTTGTDGAPDLSRVNGRVTTLMTDPAVVNAVTSATALQNIVNSASVSSLVAAGAPLATIKTSIGDAIKSDAASLASLKPPSTAQIESSKSATTYATNLKSAIKAADATYQAQQSFFNGVYLNKVVPSLKTIDAGLGWIGKYCTADNVTGNVTCTTSTSNPIVVEGETRGTLTLAGSINAYNWTGTLDGKSSTGTLRFTPNCPQAGVCTIRAVVTGGFPNNIKGEALLTLDMDITMSLNDLVANTASDGRNFSLTVNSASVNFPATSSFPASVATLTGGSVDGKIYQSGAYRNWNCWVDTNEACFIAKNASTDTTSYPTRIKGKLSMTTRYSVDNTSYSDVLSAELDARFVTPTQAQWNTFSNRTKYFFDHDKLPDLIQLTGSLYVGKYNATYSASVVMDPDWSGVDLTKGLSSTNFAKGYVAATLDGGNVNGTSLGKVTMRVERTDYSNMKPSLNLAAGGDAFTFEPNTTGGALPVKDPGLTDPSLNPARRLYPNIKWMDMSPPDASMVTYGVKAYNSNNAYIITAKKVNNEITGTVKKGDVTVGQIKDGRLYLDGLIFPMTLD